MFDAKAAVEPGALGRDRGEHSRHDGLAVLGMDDLGELVRRGRGVELAFEAHLPEVGSGLEVDAEIGAKVEDAVGEVVEDEVVRVAGGLQLGHERPVAHPLGVQAQGRLDRLDQDEHPGVLDDVAVVRNGRNPVDEGLFGVGAEEDHGKIVRLE